MDDIEKEIENPDHNYEELRAGLYIVATPIGNLGDITMRALDVLRRADLVLCEDTRVTKKLFSAYQIQAKTKSYHDHNEDKHKEIVIDRIKKGEAVALVSDAGMPLISDPGYKLVSACIEQGVYVTTLPGANAPLAALQLSGLPSDKFCFIGFLPNKTKARQDTLRQWAGAPASLIAFESAQRLKAALKDVQDVLGNRDVAVVREITKFFEECKKGSAKDLLDGYENNGLPKGEIVIVIGPPIKEDIPQNQVEDMIRDALKTMKTKDAATFVAESTGLKKNILYDIALVIEKEKKT